MDQKPVISPPLFTPLLRVPLLVPFLAPRLVFPRPLSRIPSPRFLCLSVCLSVSCARPMLTKIDAHSTGFRTHPGEMKHPVGPAGHEGQKAEVCSQSDIQSERIPCDDRSSQDMYRERESKPAWRWGRGRDRLYLLSPRRHLGTVYGWRNELPAVGMGEM